jgi:GNAT superfamily N-acetyltransferase
MAKGRIQQSLFVLIIWPFAVPALTIRRRFRSTRLPSSFSTTTAPSSQPQHDPTNSCQRGSLRSAASNSTIMIATTTTPASTTTSIRWIIRPAALTDAASCSALLQASYQTLLEPDYSDSCLSNCLPLITVAQPQLLTCGTWYVVLHPETGQMVGCGGWTARSPTTTTTTSSSGSGGNDAAVVVVPHLRHFAVHPSFTRQGIASLLWEHSLTSIRNSMGGVVPAMEVFSTLTAEAFYMSCGFQTVHHMEVELQKDLFFPCILMRREAEA